MEEGFKNIRAALEYAVKSEKLIVKVYTKAYSGITNNDAEEVIGDLIEEERSHTDYSQMLARELD